LSSLLNELEDIRQSAVLDDIDDDIDMDETVDAPPPRPEEVRESTGRGETGQSQRGQIIDDGSAFRVLVLLQRGCGPCVCVFVSGCVSIFESL